MVLKLTHLHLHLMSNTTNQMCLLASRVKCNQSNLFTGILISETEVPVPALKPLPISKPFALSKLKIRLQISSFEFGNN